MKILITGSNGLLGQKLVYGLREKQGVEIIATAVGANRTGEKTGYIYEELDITDETAVNTIVDKHHPDCIINTAAMTNVDACESDKKKCKALNVDAVAYLIKACERNSVHLIHLSTDFVFDGKNGPYSETDIPFPLSYYAWSKLEAEMILAASTISWAVIRTIIIYGVVDDEQRSNIVLWTKQSLEQKKTISVITDQFRSPTLAEDLADACISAALKRAKGIYHVSGKEIMSIIDIAYFVAEYFGLDKSYIKPVTTAELNQAAKRPLKTGFRIDKAMKELDYRPHSFKEGLDIISAQLKTKERKF